MTDREALDQLIEAVEAGKNLSWHDFWPISNDEPAIWARQAYHGSLDAANLLHKAMLSDWKAEIRTWGEVVAWPDGQDYWSDSAVEGIADNPARAWLLAILKALRERADD